MSTAAGTAPPPASLLVVVEPPSDGGQAVGPALQAEGLRVAGGLGVDLHRVTWPGDTEADAELLAAALARVAARTQPVAIILADTDLGRQLAPLLARRLGSGAVLGCSDVVIRGEPGDGSGEYRSRDRDSAGRGTLGFVKPVYGGWLEREVAPAPGAVPVAALDLTGMEEPESSAAGLPAPELVEIPAAVRPSVRRLELVPPDARSVDIVHARRIVAAGSGSASEELLAAVRELADLLEGSVGATRPVVDDGLLPKERLIGQTGRTVTPGLYLALGISGSPHHVAGVRGADRVLSINRDVRAPIFQFSDVGYVGDLQVVLPALVRKIKEWRDVPDGLD